MIFTELDLKGAWLIDLEPIEDERGFFARSWCVAEFASRGLVSKIVQCSVSFNSKAGTLRGMHYQAAPCAETKLVRCTMGAIYDVIVDIRPHSATYRRWTGIELSAVNRRALYVPEGFAHGFQTLKDDAEVFYQISTEYSESAARGLRHNDPAFGVKWPLAVTTIAEKDLRYADFEH